MPMPSVRSSAALLAVLAGVASSAHADINYWDFNVFSRSTIGTPGGAYGSDFEGASAAVGNAYFSGFTVRGVSGTSPSLPQAFYGGGNFTLQGSSPNGGLEVAGNVTLNSASVSGNVTAGGNLAGTGGTITGNVRLGGTNTASNQLTINGSVSTNQPFSPTVNLTAASSYFLNVSNTAAGLAANATPTNNFGELIINTAGPLTVVNISNALFSSAYGVTIRGGGAVVINLLGSNITMASKTWQYQNGASNTTTLLNLNQATSFNLSGGNTVNILAPNAATNYSSGVVIGNLIVGSLTGSGQVNWAGGGGFAPPPVLIPAPAAAGALAALGLLASRRRRQV